MATYKTDLATSQEAALLDSSALANDGTTHTGVLKVSTSRVSITGGITAATHTIQGLLLPPGTRVVPGLCELVISNETGMDYVATVKYRSSDESILETSFTTGTRYPNSPKSIDAEFTAPKTESQWIDVSLVESNGTSNDLIIDLYVAYVGI